MDGGRRAEMAEDNGAGRNCETSADFPVGVDEAKKFRTLCCGEDDDHSTSVDDETQVLHDPFSHLDKFVLR